LQTNEIGFDIQTLLVLIVRERPLNNKYQWKLNVAF
jgi:hypothetical protein